MQRRPDHLTAGRTFLAAAAVLSACALAASCQSSSSPQTPSVSPTSSSPSANRAGNSSSPTPGNANFSNIHQHSRVSYKQEVAGTFTGIPPGMNAWVVIQPQNVTAYWPQPGPLRTDKNHHFDAVVTFGQSASTDHGENFTLMIVETNMGGSQQFQSFLNNPQQMGLGMSGLPSNNLLTQVTVIRS